MYWVAASTAAAIASAAAMMAAAWTSSLVLHMNASNSQHPRGDYSPATGISPSHPGRVPAREPLRLDSPGSATMAGATAP